MKTAVIVGALLLSINVCSAQSSSQRDESISVSFAIDGETISCAPSVQLRLHGQLIVPEPTAGGFVVQQTIEKLASQRSPDERVGVDSTCGGYKLSFQIYPSLICPGGEWKFGIEYPPHWIKSFKRDADVSPGTWISYLDSECGDPGIITWLSHAEPPPSIPARLEQEQPRASGGRARDIAYGLAVFGNRYEQNRDYLLQLLNTCLSRPRESSEDDVCDGTLLDYVTNLYWRGDSDLLEPLLKIADSRKDVLLNIGIFYADVLDGRPAAILDKMKNLPIEKQCMICHLAQELDLRPNTPRYERVTRNLRSDGSEVANRCLQEAETASGEGARPR